ncbi:MAG TPA: XRE family transcriptional regulator [Actinobacteria bacterium]|nr:XRE family transcriptional regulator [Actinomycetota bacterium]
MADRRPPSVRARQLAAELRRLRDAATLTGEEAAGRLGWSPSKISRIETGQTAPSPADLRRVLDLYEVVGTQRERLELLGLSAGQRGWWDAYADTLGPEYTALIALEAEAESVRWYSPMLVPGLLQTEQYAREVIRSGLLIAPPGEIERRVQVKMTRQRVLTRENPLQLAVVIDEAAILRMVGGPQVMREQLAHLAAMAARPNVSVQVLPLAAGAHPATTGEFTILGFPQLIAPDVVFLENMTSDLYVEHEAEVYRYGMAFDRLRALALPPHESAAFITARADSIG